MNKQNLIKLFKKLEIDSTLYDFSDNPEAHDTILIYQEGDKWVKCYTEKGKKFDQIEFNTEGKACYALVNETLNLEHLKNSIKLHQLLIDSHRNLMFFLFSAVPNKLSNKSSLLCLNGEGSIIWESNESILLQTQSLMTLNNDALTILLNKKLQSVFHIESGKKLC